MATTDTKQQLKDLLRELFQLNNTDLDFGIYRILNIKAKEVEAFIENDIDKEIESVKAKIIDSRGADVKAELDKVKAELTTNFNVDFQKEGDLEAKSQLYSQLPLFQEPLKRFKTAKERLDSLRVSEDTEKAIYNELYRFFERYYEGGDFISKPRAGKNNYMIPYEGEEVKLYWANYDQYYIKTGDNFKNYLFNNQLSDTNAFRQVEFRIIDAETAINNNKEEKGRLFIPAENPFEWLPEERKLLVKFYYRVPNADEKATWGDKQSVKTDSKGINQKLAALVNDEAAKIGDAELLLFLKKTKTNSKGEAISLFLYHLERYTTVNKFDYFIHKDLKGFLRRELDTFLKNDVFSIAFLDSSWKDHEVQEAIRNNVLKACAIRDIALVVIAFVSELEEFQKRLFEKKKFVVESHYCMTLDRIPASVYDEVIQYVLTDTAKEQIKEWRNLNFIKDNDLDNNALSHLKTNDKLVLDTKFLPTQLKWKLLAAFDNIDEMTNGLLINSENWQGLNLLQGKYKGKVDRTFIDPPYNTGNDIGFVYKDSFQHSSWLSLMENRLFLNKQLLNKSGIFHMTLDDVEQSVANLLCAQLFGKENFLANLIWWKRHGRNNNAKTFSDVKDFVITYRKTEHLSQVQELKDTDNPKGYSNPDNDPRGVWTSISYVNPATKKERPNLVYKIKNPVTNIAVEHPLNAWKYSIEENQRHIKENRLYWGVNGGNTYPRLKLFLSETETMVPMDVWNQEYAGTTDLGSKILNNMFPEKPFSNPKPPILIERLFSLIPNNKENLKEICIDYFAGSGSTGEAIINLNKKDDINRFYILLEMGKYFETVTKPRIQKVIFSGKWKDGIPQTENNGVSQIFQYLRLEQYEDTLNNIEIQGSTIPQFNFLDNIRYQLIYGTRGSDSLLNLQKFSKPFDYSMKIVQQNEPKEGTNIDLVTTFNFLLGIEVLRYVLAADSGLEYKIVIGKKGLQQYIIIWRNFDENTIDLKAEKEFIRQQSWYNNTAFVFCNGDNAFSAHPIEPEFIRLMNEPVL